MFVLITGFGLVCFLVGVVSLRKTRDIFAQGQASDAVLVEIKEITWYASGRPVEGYRAIYAYTDEAGNEYRTPGRSRSTSRSEFSLGERRTVVYNSDSPAEVLEAPVEAYANVAFYLLIAVAMIALGMTGYVYDW